MKAQFIFENIERLKNIPYSHGTHFFEDLLDVGKTKALGYLPISSIEEIGDKEAEDDLITWAEENNFKHKTIHGGDVYFGALYIWDEQMLQNLLNKHKNILEKAGIPTNTDDYVDYIEHETVDQNKYPVAYRIVGITFNDKRFR
jgi:hypothetical protein